MAVVTLNNNPCISESFHSQREITIMKEKVSKKCGYIDVESSIQALKPEFNEIAASTDAEFAETRNSVAILDEKLNNQENSTDQKLKRLSDLIDKKFTNIEGHCSKLFENSLKRIEESLKNVNDEVLSQKKQLIELGTLQKKQEVKIETLTKSIISNDEKVKLMELTMDTING